MAGISLSRVINGELISRFSGLSGNSSGSSITSALSGNATSVSLSEGLRLGARTFANAVQGLNTLSSFVNISKSTLEDLGEITGKMIELAEQATKASSGQQTRRRLDREFRALADEFQSIVEDAKVGENELLTKEGLSDLFQVMGLDEESSDSVANLFSMFITPEEEDSLASGETKGERPVPIPTGAFSGSGSSSQFELSIAVDAGNNRTVTDGEITSVGVSSTGIEKNVTQNGLYDTYIVNKADGTQVTFESGQLDDDVVLMDVASNSGYSLIKTTTDFLGYNPSNYNQLFLVDSNGEVLQQVTNISNALDGIGEGQLSEDGLTAVSKVNTGFGSQILSKIEYSSLGVDPATATTTVIDSPGGLNTITNVRLSDSGDFVAYFKNTGLGDQMYFRDLSDNANDATHLGDSTIRDFDFIDDDQLAIRRTQVGLGSPMKIGYYRYGDQTAIEDHITTQEDGQNLATIQGIGDLEYDSGLQLTDKPTDPGFLTKEAFIYDDGGVNMTIQYTNGTTASLSASGGTFLDVIGVNEETGYSVIASDDDFLGYNLGGYAQAYLVDDTGTVVHQLTSNGLGGWTSGVSADISEDGQNVALIVQKGTGISISSVAVGTLGGDPVLENTPTLLGAGTAGDVTSIDMDTQGNDVAFVNHTTGSAYFSGDGFISGRTDIVHIGITDENEAVIVRDMGDGTYNVEHYTQGDGAFNNTIVTGLTDVSQFASIEPGSEDPGHFAIFDNTAKTITLYDETGAVIDESIQLGGLDTVTNLTLGYDRDGNVDIGVNGVLLSVNGDTDTELYKFQPTQLGYYALQAEDAEWGGSGTSYDAKIWREDVQIAEVNYNHESSSVSGLSLAYNTDSTKTDYDQRVELGITGTLPGYSNTAATEIFRLSQNPNYYNQSSFSVRSNEYTNIFSDEASLRTRADAYRVLNDLEALQEQIDENLEALNDANNFLTQNIELVRATGFAFLDISEQVGSQDDAEGVADKIEREIRKNVGAAKAQAENLESIAVASLILEPEDFETDPDGSG